ncbi:MAG TPA: organomercurial lyase [Dehalococcoidia bacterium]|nr:organomercurial lyase [Dehalococcoidia bacterium]
MLDDFDFDTRVRLHVYYHLLGSGRAPSPAETASALGTPVQQVEAALGRLHDAHLLVLAPGTSDVWMANPLSAIPTAFEVDVGERTWYGNCIWDAMGVAAMLGVNATIRTPCPDCQERLLVRVESQSLVSADGVIHFAVPARQWWYDIGYT